MLHIRKWVVETLTSASEVAKKLKEYQNECYGVQLGDILFINDSTDVGIVEYAVIDTVRDLQIDSWTVDWMSKRDIETSLKSLLTSFSTFDKYPTYNDFSSAMVVPGNL